MAERFPVFSAIVSARCLASTLLGHGLGAAFGGVGWGITAGCTILSAQDAVIQLNVRAASTPNLCMPSQSPLDLLIRLAKKNDTEEVPRQFALRMNKFI